MTKHAIARVRHEARRRILTVQQVERVTPKMAPNATVCTNREGTWNWASMDSRYLAAGVPGPRRVDHAR